ncbi:B12-binding domain-containing radical SAM protein [Anoxybacter fermentans]|uniref:B12-binding domain-containing radical SAM protein n=1 Tax=Anoxybacter fermentans TaxID=1323375 RepID=A0A3Q9HNJ3_9FIRM|nr:B12-binding domain-containing radical SAM protein [Anoxybacter fermentans]AZR72130.1 B12-binding domain-containing radical SAM protein [Anoxybacter fermentans]
MKILLTTLNSKFIHSNLALRYLRSYCRNLPLKIELKEFNINQNLDYILAEIYKTKADLVAFSCYIWNIIPTLQLCGNLKKIKPDLKIVLGGPEVSFDSENILRDHPYLDYIVRGEGEETFYELLENLFNGKEVGLISGLTYRKGNEIISTPERPLISNLDRIPSPFEDHLDEFKNRLVYYESSRGCPFNCQYCLSSTFKGVRTFSMQRIKEDLLRLIEAEVKKVKFVDRTFNFNPDHALEIMRFLVEHQKETTFHFEITAHLITDEMLDFLRQVPQGLFQFEIGVQSTHKPTLRKIKRAYNFERLVEVVKVLSSSRNIHLHLDLIAGLPEENYNRFQKSFNDVFVLRPDNLQLGFLKLLKGSGIRQNAEDYGYKYMDQPPYEVLANDLISFDEILELKMIEDLLETFYNSHKFELSVDFIITRYYRENPFAFFKEMKDYWEGQGYHHRPHKEADLYKFLWKFYKEKINKDLKIFQEYLKLDFLCSIRTHDLPNWLNPVKVKDYKKRFYQFIDDRDKIDKYIPELAHLGGKQIMRQILIEPFAFDIFAYRDKGYQGEPGNETIFVLFNYKCKDPVTGCVQYKKVPLD